MIFILFQVFTFLIDKPKENETILFNPAIYQLFCMMTLNVVSLHSCTHAHFKFLRQKWQALPGKKKKKKKKKN